jgi:hypothetical protein
MDAFMIIAASCAPCLPVWSGDLRADSDQTSKSAAAVRRLSAEFESAQRSALEIERTVKTEKERNAARRAVPDRRKYAQ